MDELTQKIEKAKELHKQGFNCSQCVAMVFPEISNLDEQTVASLMSGFGGGVGGQGEICGAVSGAVMLEGMRRAPGKGTKMMTYSNVKDVSERFIKENGSLICRELRGKDEYSSNGNKINRKPCMQYIEDAIRIYYDYLNEDNK